jgi:hypothetical protein
MTSLFNNLRQYSPGISIKRVRRTTEILRHDIPGPGFHLGISKIRGRITRLVVSLNVEASYKIVHTSEISVIASVTEGE